MIRHPDDLPVSFFAREPRINLGEVKIDTEDRAIRLRMRMSDEEYASTDLGKLQQKGYL